MTKEEWAEVEKALRDTYHIVKLRIDGYEVALVLERQSAFKNAIAVYINGKMKMEYSMEDCEERRRFFFKSQRSVPMKKEQREAWKRLTKKQQAELEKKYRLKYNVYLPWWGSFSGLKRHFITNNQDIQLVSIGS